MQNIENNTTGNMMSEMMHHCAKNMRWMPLFPLTIGITLFLLGYFLQPDVVRILFLVLTGIPVIMGVIGLVMMNSMRK